MSVILAPPLQQALARVASACGLQAVLPGPPPAGDGWVSGADLVADPDLLRTFIDVEADRIEAEYGTAPRRHVAATWALHRYLLLAGMLLGGPLLLERRVPALRPADIAMHPAGPRVAVTVEGFACLPEDPAAGLPEARVVADVAALRAELRRTAAAHFGPVLEVFARAARCGRGTLWRVATDQLAGGLWHLGRTLGREAETVAETDALLPGDTPPFSAASFRRLPLPAGGDELTRTRLHCCLYYTVGARETCFTCPRTGDDERLRRRGDAGTFTDPTG
jgi:hypothetical protein